MTEKTDSMAGLAGLAGHIERFNQLNHEIAAANDALKEMRAEFDELRFKVLPAEMERLGLSGRPQVGSSTLEIAERVYPSVRKDDHERLRNWMMTTGRGDLCKTVIEFRGVNDDDLRRMLEAAGAESVPISFKHTVHNMTLQAMIREALEAGEDIPDFVNLYERKEVKVNPLEGEY